MRESQILKEIWVALVKVGLRIFRNNTGVLQDRNGTYVRYGLCPGSSDLIGWKSIEVTPEMVGRKLAVFTACEVKRPGQFPTLSQQRFIAAVRDAGGIGMVASSTAEALDAIQK